MFQNNFGESKPYYKACRKEKNMGIENFMKSRKKGVKLLGKADYVIFLIAFLALVVTLIFAFRGQDTSESKDKSKKDTQQIALANLSFSKPDYETNAKAEANIPNMVVFTKEAPEDANVASKEVEESEDSTSDEIEAKQDSTSSETKKEEIVVHEDASLEDAPIYEKYGLTEYEFNVLCKTIWHEYGYGCVEGQAGVASVVLNRVKSEYFPDNIVDVILAPNQFSPKYGEAPFVEPTETMLEAIDIAFSGKDYSNGAIYFANPELITNEKTLAWFNSLEVCNQYEGVVFYK